MNDASFSQIINKSPSNRYKDGAIDSADVNVSPDIYELYMRAWADLEGWIGGLDPPPPPPEKSQNIVFLSNTGPDHLKNHKVTKLAFMFGPSSARQRNVSRAGRRWHAYSGIWIIPPLRPNKNQVCSGNRSENFR